MGTFFLHLSLFDFFACTLGIISISFYFFTSEKNIHDENGTKFDKDAYISKNWDNWIFQAISGYSLLCILPETYIYYMEVISGKNAIGTTNYFVGFSFLIGVMGAFIFEKLYSSAKKKIEKHTDDNQNS